MAAEGAAAAFGLLVCAGLELLELEELEELKEISPFFLSCWDLLLPFPAPAFFSSSTWLLLGPSSFWQGAGASPSFLVYSF